LAGLKKTDPPELLAAFEEALKQTKSIAAASRLCGWSKAVGKRLVVNNPSWRSYVAQPGELSRKHGCRNTVEYRAWVSMRNRCFNANDRDYQGWGGRGITVCSRWDSFELFLQDMGPRPSPRHSIDRIDNDGHYEPGNCRWATIDAQNQNRRTTTFVEFNGERRSVSEWARVLGLPQSTLWNRLYDRGWSVERSLTQPRASVS
jgi:hypothetical protein